MKLFTKAIDKKLFKQYETGSSLKNQKVVAKIFNPYGRGTWYILNSDPNDPNYLWAIVDLFEIEMGSVSRAELEGIKVPPFGLPLERDTGFKEVNALEFWDKLMLEKRKSGREFKDGGRTSIVNDGVSFSKDKYTAIFGDYDKDGVANIDDANPLNKNKKGKVEEIELSKSFEKLIEIKNDLDSEMDSMIKKLEDNTDKTSNIYARTKTPYSIVKKLIDKRLLDSRKGLTDLVGTTVATEDYMSLLQLRKKIKNGDFGTVIEEEDMYKNPKGGYRAYHYILKDGKSPIELQLKTKRMKEVNEISHEFYKDGSLDSKNLESLTALVVQADLGDKDAIRDYEKIMSNKNSVKALLSTKKFKYGGKVDEKEEAINTLYKIADEADNKINYEGGGIQNQSDKNIRTYAKYVDTAVRSRMKPPFDSYIHDELEDSNEHSLNLILGLLGHYKEEKDSGEWAKKHETYKTVVSVVGKIKPKPVTKKKADFDYHEYIPSFEVIAVATKDGKKYVNNHAVGDGHPLLSGFYVSEDKVSSSIDENQTSMFKSGGKMPKHSFYIKRRDIDYIEVGLFDDEVERKIDGAYLMNGAWFDGEKDVDKLNKFKKENKSKKKAKANKKTKYIAKYDGKTLELESKDLFTAKTEAIKDMKIPKSKVNLLIIKPESFYKNEDFRFM